MKLDSVEFVLVLLSNLSLLLSLVYASNINNCNTPVQYSDTSVNVTFRGAISYPVGTGRFSQGSFGGLQWFPYVSNPCNGSVTYSSPNVLTLLYLYADNLMDSMGYQLSGVGFETFVLASPIRNGVSATSQNITYYGGNVSIDIHLGTIDGCSLAVNAMKAGTPPCLNDVLNQGTDPSNILFQLTNAPILQFFDGVPVGAVISLVYPALPTSHSELSSRLIATGYSDYYTLRIDGSFWEIRNYNSTFNKVQASGFFDVNIPCNDFDQTQSAALCKDTFQKSPVFV